LTKHCKQLLCSLMLMMCLASAKAQSDSSYRQPRKPFIPRTIDWGYRIIEGDSAHPRKFLIFPFPIVAYKPETRWILGVSLTYIFKASKDSITRPSTMRANIAYSQNQQFSFIPSFDYFSDQNRWNIRGKYTYTNFGEYYYGIGKDAPSSNKEFYSFRMHKANLKVATLLFPKLYAGLQYNFEQMYGMQSVTGGVLQTGKPPGYNGYLASGLGFTVYYDTREHVYFPHKGWMVELSNVFYDYALGSEYNFMNVTLDARKYIHLWKENVLALQGFVSLNTGETPFRMEGVIGSDVFMRGYYNGRFRDQHAMAFQAELRKTIWGPIGMVAFAGGGTVSDYKWGLFSGIKPNVGVGLRIKAIPSQRLNLRIDYGWGSHGSSAAYISMNEAF